MPRTKKGTGKKTSDHPMTSEARPITTWSMRSAETRAESRTQEETSRTTRTATKRQSASTNPPHVKRQRAGTVANTRREFDSEDALEVDDTPLTRADIPKIVNAVLSITFPRKAPAQRTTAKLMGRTSVSTDLAS